MADNISGGHFTVRLVESSNWQYLRLTVRSAECNNVAVFVSWDDDLLPLTFFAWAHFLSLIVIDFLIHLSSVWDFDISIIDFFIHHSSVWDLDIIIIDFFPFIIHQFGNLGARRGCKGVYQVSRIIKLTQKPTHWTRRLETLDFPWYLSSDTIFTVFLEHLSTYFLSYPLHVSCQKLSSSQSKFTVLIGTTVC